MPTTLESVDKKTGTLNATDVINAEITQIIATLGVYRDMLPLDRDAEKATIEYVRNCLVELRMYLNKHFQYKAE